MYGKSPEKYEEPMVNYLYYISNQISKKYNISPNLITTIRLLLMIAVYYLIYSSQFKVLAGIFYLFCFFLDHLDGEMARQHNTSSTFGDYYDHITDCFYELPVFFLLFIKLKNHPNFKILFLIFLILIFTSTVFVSCQEVYLSKNNDKAQSEALEKLKNLCLINDLKIIKYFGQGLFHLYVFYLIIL